MIVLNELLEQPLMQNFTIIAGKAGLNNKIQNVDIFEYEWDTQNFDGFHRHDLVLISLFFAKDNPELILKCFKRLSENKISAIAVKTIFFKELPKEVIDFCEANDLPLLLFHTTYMEDIVISFNELVKLKQHHIFLEDNIHQLLNKVPDKYLLEEIAHSINSEFLPDFIAIYCIHRKSPDSPREIFSCLNKMLYREYQNRLPYNVSFLKYKNGLLIIYSLHRDDDIDNASHLAKKMLELYSINPKNFYIGISNRYGTEHHLHEGIQESIDAASLCRKNESDICTASKLGIYNFLYPLNREPAFQKLKSAITSCLNEYDSKYTSNLLETLRLYVKNHGEISSTANELYQHPNTIRYRLQKAHQLLEPYLGKDNFYEQIFIIFHS